MLGVIFGLLVVTALTVHYVLVERPRQRALELEGPRPVPLALADIVGKVPEGVFLHPTLTWGRLRPNGDVDLGIHPLLLGLVGESREINPRGELGRLEKGDPIADIVAGDRELIVRSPTSGRMVATNPRATADASWRGATWDDGSWVCRLNSWISRIRSSRGKPPAVRELSAVLYHYVEAREAEEHAPDLVLVEQRNQRCRFRDIGGRPGSNFATQLWRPRQRTS